MYPEIVRIGNFAVHSYGLMIALAILVSAILLYREAPQEKLDPDHVLEAVIIASFFGLIGSRILYMLLNWDYYSGRFFSSFFSQFEGLSFYGGLFGGVFALLLWSRKRNIGFLKMTDFLAPYLALGYAFGRIGCFLNGCCYGKEASVPWALPIQIGDPVLRHPVQLYAALGALIIFFILRALRRRRPFVGFILIALFALYGILRFTTEFFRFSPFTGFGLTSAQIFSLALTLASLTAIAFFYFFQDNRKNKKEKTLEKGRSKKTVEEKIEEKKEKKETDWEEKDG